MHRCRALKLLYRGSHSIVLILGLCGKHALTSAISTTQSFDESLTLATDDPCIQDEMSLPTVAWFKTGDVPPASEVDIEVDISKRITEDFGVTIGDTWSHIRQK